MSSLPGVFQCDTFLSVALSQSWCMSASGSSSCPCIYFFMLFIHLIFLLCFFFFSRILPFLCTRLSLCMLPRTAGIFSFIVLECPFLLYYLTLSRYLLSLPSFANVFCFISYRSIVSLVGCCLYFLSFHFVFSFHCVLSLVFVVSLLVLLALFPFRYKSYTPII